MKSAQELLKERTARVKKAIALEKPDRTPIILTADAFCAYHMGVKLSDFVFDVKLSSKTIYDSLKALGEVDGTGGAFCTARLFPLMAYAKMKLPGVELPDNAFWQIDEQELMAVADYDTILDKGWAAFSKDYIANRLKIDVPSLLAETAKLPELRQNFVDAGYVVYIGAGASITVNEYLSAARTFPKFMRDMFKMPDKVEAVLDIILAETLEKIRKQIRAANPTVVFVSPSRGASQFYSPKIWQRFVWKYLKATVDAIIAEGAVANIHIDGNWERDLEFFKDFPKGKVVFETDGATDIYKIKEVLGDRMCIKGDVPAALLTVGNPEEVYNYCTNLIKNMGLGFILSTGCTVPPNAKVENMQAMVAAATGK
ncbi:uroporphyrinogen decarboxylase family protein [Sporomusa acidovorans]|uniref:Uroporphyrinogen decarboxylase n=1 Tax=Sporomusa acidovorans (strain ATCC 49682 / DSM 3132 / Mol) TaxID=1123286 RepID=A0ABZ3J054_SPOA4|nr:uroporphyrinogen decarboxylase family protein [Sporomusa acidovorans]OZC21307.1 uroporphyrinogen decarboxylase [Sporomusa acidovorans DSM 3132]SDF83832.1 Uroporphyrinogen decarboxylase (URO-D) [Sporomusa acidovorans]